MKKRNKKHVWDVLNFSFFEIFHFVRFFICVFGMCWCFHLTLHVLTCWDFHM